MVQLLEHEVFDCLMSNLRMASENCIRLAKNPSNGKMYTDLQSQLSLIEGASRQVSVRRLDVRWVNMCHQIGAARPLVGGWIRKYRYKNDKFLQELFTKLGEFLAFAYAFSNKIKDEKTGVFGAVLPEGMSERTIKSKNDVAMRISHGGIIIPDGCSI
jgi:hypothetical protein